jgi:hypothetical protein
MLKLGARGAALIDVVFTCGFIAILATIAIPSLHASRERDAGVLAARHVASKLNLLRVEAIRRNGTVAMRFDPNDIGRYAMYADGDGDGVSQHDVDSGIDAAIGHDAHVTDQFAGVNVRIPLALPAPDGGVLDADSDPLRIGSSNFVSFGPLGTSTSGTIYISGGGTQLCVRIFGATARVRVLRFDRATRSWRQD